MVRSWDDPPKGPKRPKAKKQPGSGKQQGTIVGMAIALVALPIGAMVFVVAFLAHGYLT